ncbi:hypothetical protein D9M70_464310 [compost metagenome]
MTRRLPAPALEGMAQAGGFAEAEFLGDAVDGDIALLEHFLGAGEAQFVQQLLVAGLLLGQVAAQAARGAVHLPRQFLQSRRVLQARVDQAAHPFEPGAAGGELDVLPPALFEHFLVGHRVGQGQAAGQPGGIEADGAAARGKFHRAAEAARVGSRHAAGGRVIQLRRAQRQGLAQQVGEGDLERAQADLGVERPQRFVLAVAGSGQPGGFAFLFQGQAEVGAQQHRVAEADAQGLAESGRGEHGVAQQAVGGDARAQAKRQPQGRPRCQAHGVGIDLLLLLGVDQALQLGKVLLADAAAGQHVAGADPLLLQQCHGQRRHVQRVQPGGAGEDMLDHSGSSPTGWPPSVPAPGAGRGRRRSPCRSGWRPAGSSSTRRRTARHAAWRTAGAA